MTRDYRDHFQGNLVTASIEVQGVERLYCVDFLLATSQLKIREHILEPGHRLGNFGCRGPATLHDPETSRFGTSHNILGPRTTSTPKTFESTSLITSSFLSRNEADIIFEKVEEVICACFTVKHSTFESVERIED